MKHTASLMALDEICKNHLEFLFKGFLPSWRRIVDPENEVAVFTEVEARLNALAHEQGELRMFVPMLYIRGALG